MAQGAEALIEQRHTSWRQTPETRIAGDEEAPALIDRLGIVTLYPASPEVPNLYHAYVGDPNAKTEAKWDSPSGTVYSWRWTLGRKEAAFYAVLVRKRPTFVSWQMLPVALRLFADLRMPDELYDLGVISASAYRIAQALEASGGVLSTGALRDATGFPAGKDHRNAYLKAMEELDTRLLLAKFFAKDDDDAHHALVYMRYREYVDAAEKLTREQALDQMLHTYLANAAYAAPAVLARHLRLEEPELRAGLDRLVDAGQAEKGTLSGYKGECFVWTRD
ncbi:MAG TPA: hypothetical protein VGP82_22465 [Ktedonobacterales bacterium]|jgi:hypothetical protein|nr:hypothetical protein [Ktedonobacterales bacterium]